MDRQHDTQISVPLAEQTLFCLSDLFEDRKWLLDYMLPRHCAPLPPELKPRPSASMVISPDVPGSEPTSYAEKIFTPSNIYLSSVRKSATDVELCMQMTTHSQLSFIDV